tara:strand:+ start:160 stop:1476 length:1317 start_codon:yes stop_codon:yes gene_type:complete
MKRLIAIVLFCVLVPCAYGEAIYYDNGDKYVGELRYGKYHGQGTYTWTNGEKHVGEWKDGKYHGQGTHTWTNGEKHVGEWRDGKVHGQGTHTWTNGNKYVGEYKYGRSHGQGTFTYATSSTEFSVCNWETGSGCKTDAIKYVGTWKDGSLHGRGTYSWRDGRKYVGEFKDSMRNGQGITTWADGTKYVGEYKDDKRWQGVIYLVSSEIAGTFSDGEWCGGCKPTATHLAIVREIRTNRKLIGTGTGFLVNRNYIITADHVLDGCNEVTVRHRHKEYFTDITVRDSSNDLGLLRLQEPFADTAKLRDGKAVRLGAVISTYGYPLFGVLSDNAKITQGNINSLAGHKNNSGHFQYDAPSQFGNSGGPLLDTSGNVIGVVVSGLNDAKTQSVNFAVKSYLVEGFLSSNNVSFEKAESTEKLELPDIAEKAEKFTVLVGCWE